MEGKENKVVKRKSAKKRKWHIAIVNGKNNKDNSSINTIVNISSNINNNIINNSSNSKQTQ